MVRSKQKSMTSIGFILARVELPLPARLFRFAAARRIGDGGVLAQHWMVGGFDQSRPRLRLPGQDEPAGFSLESRLD